MISLAAREAMKKWGVRIGRIIRDDPEIEILNRSDAVAAIQYFLSSTGQAGDDRRFFEALPHVDPVDTVSGLRQVLFRLGFTTTTEPVDPAQLRNEFLPCFIITPQNTLAVVGSEIADGQVDVYVPARNQNISVPVADISGLAVYPELAEAQISAAQTTVKDWTRKVFRIFAPTIRKIFWLSLAINIFSLMLPLYVMAVYDRAIGANSFEVLAGLTLGILLIVSAEFALRTIRVRIKAYLGARIDNQASSAAFRKLMFFPLSMTEDAPIGSQLTRLKQMGAVRDAFTGALSTAIFDLPFVILFLIAMAIIGGPLALIPLGLIGVCVILAFWVMPRNRILLDKMGDSKRRLHNLSVETISAHDVIRRLHCEDVWVERYRRISAEAANDAMRTRQFNLLVQSIIQAMTTLCGVVILMLGAVMIIDDALSTGALIALMAFAWRILNPIRSLFMASMTLSLTTQGLRQIDQLMAARPERSMSTVSPIARNFNGDIIFDRLSFRYPLQSEPTLLNVSFAIKKGELLAICGPGGAGKSTIQKLLLGLHQQQAGSIFIDGIDLRQFDVGEWRRATNVMPEFTDLYYGTISQNIRLAHPDATDEEINEVVEKFRVDAYFDDILKDGLETRVTAARVDAWPDALLKRISLCRTFVRHRPICILDNPASNLDPEGERALLRELEARRGAATTIMATHRPSHMRLADKLLVIKQGMVAAFGAPSEVFAKLQAG